jgi:serine/threonine-protein kinase
MGSERMTLRSQDGPLTIGENFLGKYEIVKLIGRGGNACVYEALHKFMGKRVALKVLHRPGGLTREALQRGQAEAQLMNAIRHQHIVEVSDAGLTGDGTLYIVMELLEGRNLRETLNEYGTLAVEEALLLCAQIAEGTHAAHLAGAIHRDLKPDNAFITSQNRVKVLDFGVMKLVDAAAWSTQKGIAHGTPLYMSPEQLHLRPVGPTSDIYTLGLILYEALIGRHPVYLLTDTLNPTLWEIGRVAANMVPPRVDQLDPRIPNEVGLVVERALAKAPPKRFQTMKDFAKAMLDARANWLEFAQRSGIAIAARDLSLAADRRPGRANASGEPDTEPVARPMFFGALSSTSGHLPQAHVRSATPFDGAGAGPRTEILDESEPPPAQPFVRKEAHPPHVPPNSSAPTATLRFPGSPTPAGVEQGARASAHRAERRSLKALPYFLAGVSLAGIGGAAYVLLPRADEGTSELDTPLSATSAPALPPSPVPVTAQPRADEAPPVGSVTAPEAVTNRARVPVRTAAPPGSSAPAAVQSAAAAPAASDDVLLIPLGPADGTGAAAPAKPLNPSPPPKPVAAKAKSNDDLEDLFQQTERKLQAEERKQRAEPRAR